MKSGVGSNEWRGAPDGELDLTALGRALWAKRLLILALTLGVAGFAFMAVNVVSPKYKAESRVLIETRENVFLRPDADTATDRATMDAEAIQSQVQLIQSRELAMDVIKRLNLAARPDFDPVLRGGSVLQTILSLFGIGRDPISMTPEERVLRSYYDKLTVFVLDKSRVISIEFEAADPDLAARVANAIAEGYLKLLQQAKQGQSRTASQYLAREIESLRPKVAEAETKVEEFRAGTNLLVGSNSATIATQQLGEYNTQVAAAKAQKADADAKARLIRDALRAGKPLEFSEIVNSDLMRRLTEQRVTLTAQHAEQSSTLLPLHPRIKELRAQIIDLEYQMREEAERIARTMESDARVAAAKLDSLNAGLDQLKQQAGTSNEQEVQLRALEREAKAQRDLLESYLTKYREAAARDNIDAASPDARIISRAILSTTPSWPKKLPTVVIAALAMFVLASGFILTAALLGGGAAPVVAARERERVYVEPRSEPSERREPFWSRWFKRTPKAEPAVAAPVPPARPMPKMPVTPAVSAMIDELSRELRQEGAEGRRVTVVGTIRGAGASSTAINLARTLSRQGKVVLVDLALAGPSLSSIAADPNIPGLTDLIRGQASFGQVITRDRHSPVHLIMSGKVGLDTAAILASQRLMTTLEALSRTYDHVIVDSGAMPELPVERFARLAPRAVLVADDLGGRPTVAARDRLLKAGFNAVTVITGVPMRAAA